MTGLDELINRIRQNIGRRQDPLGPESVKCRICRDTGIATFGEVAWICACQRQSGRLRNQAGIAPEMKDYSLDRFRIEYYDGQHRERALAALQGARQFVRECTGGRPSQGIMFTGDVGAGKTFLAGAIANALLEQEIRAQFLVVPDFLDDLRTAMLHNTGEAQEPDDVTLLRSVRQAEVLILDDLGAHNYTEWTCNRLYSLLNYRLNYQLPVIITTNLKISELDEYLGERTTSRIVQMCRLYRLTVDRDIRHLQAKRNEV